MVELRTFWVWITDPREEESDDTYPHYYRKVQGVDIPRVGEWIDVFEDWQYTSLPVIGVEHFFNPPHIVVNVEERTDSPQMEKYINDERLGFISGAEFEDLVNMKRDEGTVF